MVSEPTIAAVIAWTPIITLAFIVLLPMIPAYILFRALPSTGNVEGKLKGMEIKLGGAFAGYFAMVLVIFYEHDIWSPPPPPPPPTAVVWRLSGQVVDDAGHAIEPLSLTDFSFSPPNFMAIPGGNFDMAIPTEPREGGGVKYPILVISHENYVPVAIPLDPAQANAELTQVLGVSRDEVHKQIKLQHIVLKAAAPYVSTGQPPQRGAP